ncbi:MAG TPA: YdbH domain-containing protein [Lacunisphaera sp.]|nr:YdbH domain-containing protein [Lacunisphaera sp.]
MPAPPNPVATRSRWRLVGATLALLLLAVFLLRQPLAGLAVRGVFHLLGAEHARFEVIRASPWHLELAGVEFRVRTHDLAAGRVTVDRQHWWSPTLGVVRATAARVAFSLDGSGVDPWHWASYRNGEVRFQPFSLPFDEFSAEGTLGVRAAGAPEAEIAARFALRHTDARRWSGPYALHANGLAAAGALEVEPGGGSVAFTVDRFELEVGAWQDMLQRLVLPPGGPARIDGQVTGHASGRIGGGRVQVGGELHLRGGSYRHPTRAIAAEGVEFDLELLEQRHFATRPGALRARELRIGRLELRDVVATFGLESSSRLAVTQASFSALGGRADVEPFQYRVDGPGEVDVVVRAEGLDLAEVLRLAPGVPARGHGRIAGRLPLRIDFGGARLAPGWLALAPGESTELELHAPDLLTPGLKESDGGYLVRKQLELGLRRLVVHELRLDIHPPGAPRGVSSHLHLAGEPVGGGEAVALDLDVNRPLENLIDLDLDALDGR